MIITRAAQILWVFSYNNSMSHLQFSESHYWETRPRESQRRALHASSCTARCQQQDNVRDNLWMGFKTVLTPDANIIYKAAEAAMLCPYLGRKTNRAKSYLLQTGLLHVNMAKEIMVWGETHCWTQSRKTKRTTSQVENGSGAISMGTKIQTGLGVQLSFRFFCPWATKQVVKKSELHLCKYCCALDREGGGFLDLGCVG